MAKRTMRQEIRLVNLSVCYRMSMLSSNNQRPIWLLSKIIREYSLFTWQGCHEIVATKCHDFTFPWPHHKIPWPLNRHTRQLDFEKLACRGANFQGRRELDWPRYAKKGLYIGPRVVLHRGPCSCQLQQLLMTGSSACHIASTLRR